ncbi:MAG TPA: type II toxin-antitoxin system prevent-host-death family antitoxin [Vicinamibacterales bacterium]|nr:type II toxin-antitoxin system prevent-host-death family antitoxin [Vicinamibacterales bacterium]
MAAIGIREARKNLSVYLDRVKRGETVTITEHGLPVAILQPVEATDHPVLMLVAAGRAQPATRRASNLPKPRRQTGPRSLSRLLRDLNGDTI